MRLFKFLDHINYDFVRQRYIAFFVTGVMVLGSVGLLGFKGLNLGIDFTGGIMMEIKTPEAPNLVTMREQLNGLGLGDISIQEFGTPQNLLIRVPEQKGGVDAQKNAIETIKTTISGEFAGKAVEYQRSEYVGPQVGDELKRSGVIAFVLTIIGIMGYIWYRFE